MKIDLHLVFPGTCDAAFGFYETVFGVERVFTMKYGDAPEGPVPPGAEGLVMHTAFTLGNITLMGCDTPPGVKSRFGGFHVSVSTEDEAEVRRLFGALSDGGSVQMVLGRTFWTPLFGMCTDKFGVEWMLGVPGPNVA